MGTRLTWISEDGQEPEIIGSPDNYVQFVLSPDGTRVAASIQEADGIRDLWIIDLERGARTRFTFSSREDKKEYGEPLWSPDGKWVAYQSRRGGTRDIYRKPADGMGDEELLLGDDTTNLWPYDWSPDGKYIVYGREMEEQNNAEDLLVFPVSGDGAPIRITDSSSSVWPGNFSPDGRWLAYASPESGRSEIYVVPFPALDGRWQVSTNGGHFPRWGPDGSRLYFWHNNHKLMEASMKASGSTLQVGAAQEVLTIAGRAGWHAYGIGENEDRFLVLAADDSLVRAPISLFFNWQEELKRR